MKKFKNNKGITLVALIITIIVLLILAVVAISAVQGDGIIAHAKNARDDYQTAQETENTALAGYLTQIENANGNISDNDEDEETVVGSATFCGYYVDGNIKNMIEEECTLTWDELKLEENGEKFNYDSTLITDETIGEEVFEENEVLTSIIIPNTVTTIGDRAFSMTNLTSIIIPSNVTNIGYLALYGGYMINVNENNQYYSSIDGILFNKAKTTLIAYPCCKENSTYEIPSSVTKIEDYAFEGSNLTSITIPNSVTSIGQGCFEWCQGLTSIKIPSGVTSIEGWMFSRADNLETVTLCGNITSIDDDAFFNQRNVEIRVISEAVKTLVQNSGYTGTITVDTTIN